MKPTLIDPFEVSPNGTPRPGHVFHRQNDDEPSELAPPPALFQPPRSSAGAPADPPTEISPGPQVASPAEPQALMAGSEDGSTEVHASDDRPTFLDGPPPQNLHAALDPRDRHAPSPRPAQPNGVAAAPTSPASFLAARPRHWLRVGLWASDS